jgi:dTMP kinase
MEFHLKVHKGYKKLASMYPNRIKEIDSNREIEEIFKDIHYCLENNIEF